MTRRQNLAVLQPHKDFAPLAKIVDVDMAKLRLMRPQTGETNGEWRARFSVLTCGDSMIPKA
jgi:hypothetical protein